MYTIQKLFRQEAEQEPEAGEDISHPSDSNRRHEQSSLSPNFLSLAHCQWGFLTDSPQPKFKVIIKLITLSFGWMDHVCFRTNKQTNKRTENSNYSMI